MTEPTVSIVTAGFNCTWVLPQLAKNLAAIRFPECEIIFVDDGSTDGSADLFEKLVPDATVIRQPNRGVAVARNVGARAARGRYLQMLDCDDTLEPGKLQAQAAAADREGFDAVYSKFRIVIVRGTETTFEPFQGDPPKEEMVEALLRGEWWAPPVAYIFRRKAFWDLGGCDEALRCWDDFDLYVRFALAGKRHGYVPGNFANYFRYLDRKSLSRFKPMENTLERERILRMAVETLAARNELTLPRRQAAAKALHGVVRGVPNYDRAWLDRMVETIYQLDPGFQPTGNWLYRAIARSAGLPTAERCAILTRPLRRKWRHFFPAPDGMIASEIVLPSASKV